VTAGATCSDWQPRASEGENSPIIAFIRSASGADHAILTGETGNRNYTDTTALQIDSYAPSGRFQGRNQEMFLAGNALSE
jgi:hypothetical protein